MINAPVEADEDHPWERSQPVSSTESSLTGCLTRKKVEGWGWQERERTATLREDWSYDLNMADKGPFLTSCIIFYLSIGAAIFQILEEPNWKSARDKYILQKENILKSHPCLSDSDLEDILKVDIVFTDTLLTICLRCG